jgi:hypothetical protein
VCDVDDFLDAVDLEVPLRCLSNAKRGRKGKGTPLLQHTQLVAVIGNICV